MLYLQYAEKDGLFLRCCKQAFTYFVFRLVALIISYRNIRSCRDIQRHNGLIATISHTVSITLNCNQLECLLNWVRIKHVLNINRNILDIRKMVAVEVMKGGK